MKSKDKSRDKPKDRSREITLLLQALAAGAFALPLLIWVAGRVLLGPYANGGPFALWFDFVGELFRGSFAACIVLLAPYVLLSAGRYAWRSTRRRA